MSYFHRMQLGTYMYMLRKGLGQGAGFKKNYTTENLTEARILKISKDDLRMSEEVLNWSPVLESEVFNYWMKLNDYWSKKKFPPCTCADQEGGFMAKEAYNPFYYNGEPCSLEWFEKYKGGSDEK